LTRGAFSAQTSSERTACLREWLASEPASELVQQVYKELSSKDKGAAKLLREKLDADKRNRNQAHMVQEWADKAQALLDLPKLNLADALAWQRDAAKAGAPLSKEPLAALRAQLADRVRVIEDLQHRVQVQREAAVLLAQRIEVLSTKSWRDAQAAQDGLHNDVNSWQQEALALMADACWPSVEPKFPPLLEASTSQLTQVWDAFDSALSQALAAHDDASAALPEVPVWADELRVGRGEAVQAAPKPAKPKVDPELRAQAAAAVRDVLEKLELEVGEGHGKASAGAANALRAALKAHGHLIDDRLDKRAHSALAAAGELEGWQRWRADQLREELVAKAEALLNRPEGQAMGGRKMQDALRQLREQWKQVDQGGVPNHGLWKRFDHACNQAHRVVEAWLDQLKAENAEHKAQRLQLIEELKAWTLAHAGAQGEDWKDFARALHQFAERWRTGGHVGEKLFAELQGQWKAAMDAAGAPLKQLQKNSLAMRQQLIEEARQLAAEPALRIDAIKAMQQRWQHEAHTVPLERRQEQKLWEAFRKPIDDAFARKSADRARVEQAMSEHDDQVMRAAKALQAANDSGDAQRIRAAMADLEQAMRNPPVSPATPPAEAPAEASASADTADTAADVAAETPAEPDVVRSDEQAPAAAVSQTSAPKPVVAMRGDDRPGMKKDTPAPAARGVKPGQRPERGGRPGSREVPGMRAERAQGPRLGDAAFRAQRDALDQAQFALRRLAAQAHGEALSHLLTAWEQRQADAVPSAQELGSRVSPAVRNSWVKALSATAAEPQANALLRLEMAAEVPTPAEHLSARRMLQLQLLTRRNDPSPAQTWGEDTAQVLAQSFDAAGARRLQNVLKVLLKR
jgi:ATP-dependent RNA helicase SUPV3L1/SUV3